MRLKYNKLKAMKGAKRAIIAIARKLIIRIFGAGFLHGYVKGGDPRKACRLGNACGAMVASRHCCSISMPFWEEVMAFVRGHGGL